MKKRKTRFWRIVKWGSIGLFAYWFLTTLIMGHTNIDSRTGIQSFGWSGLDELFTDQKFGIFFNEEYKTKLNGVDGPYIYGDVVYNVNSTNQLIKGDFDRNSSLNVVVNNMDKDEFSLTLKDSFQLEADTYSLPSKMIAISDIEGNFNAFYSFLLNNKIIDENYNWIYGEGHLVLNGDFFDRGRNVNQVLWLIYMLEDKALQHGGKVHFINGNHEIMNLKGDVSYSDMRYIEVAKQISNNKHWDEASKFLYSEESDLGNWLRSKNVIEKIGKYIFVHGGLNKKHIDQELSIPEINQIAKKYYDLELNKDDLTAKERLVLGSYNSPYWDRGFSIDWKYKTAFFFNAPFNELPQKTPESDLNEVLKFYEAEKIVIGHSVVGNVSADYNGKVIKIDVKHGIEKDSPQTQGLLIEDGIEYKVDGLGNKERLE